MVRQLFEVGVLQSGFWHQFAMTAHSPVGMDPEAFGVIPQSNDITFAHNDIQFTDTTGIDHDKFSFGLKKSLFNYMHGIGLDYDLQEWFEFKIPRTKVAPNFIEDCLNDSAEFKIKPSSRIIWLGNNPKVSNTTKSKKGITWELMQLVFHDKNNQCEIVLDLHKGEWLLAQFCLWSVHSATNTTIAQVKADFETRFEDFELFWFSKPMLKLKDFGLIML
jgi:hypothetical protein